MITGVTDCSSTCENGGDVNGDGFVTSADFFAWVVAFGDEDPPADQNCDGLYNGSDFFAWVNNFGNDCL
ncbi:MAG: GC-type dockerin domain-anchored protein [Planctomycetota bacterium]